MERDTDKSMPPEPPTSLDQAASKEKREKLKRADQELKKCVHMGSGKFKERVLKSYSCAWQKDILVQGRLHLTQNWICFYSNILGWETKTNINLKDVTAISKQKTALVFPNAILIQVGDKKYGFTSFVHRDHAYKVLQLIWQNSQLHQPSNHDTLRSQLTHLFDGHTRSKSFQESSDMDASGILDSTPPHHSRCSSFPSTPNTRSSLSQPRLSHLTITSESDLGTESEEVVVLKEEVDAIPLCKPQRHFMAFNSSNSSRSCSEEEEEEDKDESPLCLSSLSSGHEEEQSSDSDPLQTSDNSLTNYSFIRHRKALNRSPSISTLRPAIIQPQTLLGGSPNFLHHWKRTLSARTLWQNVATIAKPEYLVQFCTPSRLINMLILLFIILLLLSTVSMVCQLSRVEPALQPYLAWQPWCSCAGRN